VLTNVPGTFKLYTAVNLQKSLSAMLENAATSGQLPVLNKAIYAIQMAVKKVQEAGQVR